MLNLFKGSIITHDEQGSQYFSRIVHNFCRPFFSGPVHYGRVVTFGCKSNHKVVNFGKWFLCQFSPKTWNLLHEAFLTPQKPEDEKVLKNIGMQRGEKIKKTWRGCFSQTKLVPKNLFWWMLWYLFFEHLWKTPPSMRKLHPKSEKIVLQISHLFFNVCE